MWEHFYGCKLEGLIKFLQLLSKFLSSIFFVYIQRTSLGITHILLFRSSTRFPLYCLPAVKITILPHSALHKHNISFTKHYISSYNTHSNEDLTFPHTLTPFLTLITTLVVLFWPHWTSDSDAWELHRSVSRTLSETQFTPNTHSQLSQCKRTWVHWFRTQINKSGINAWWILLWHFEILDVTWNTWRNTSFVFLLIGKLALHRNLIKIDFIYSDDENSVSHRMSCLTALDSALCSYPSIMTRR